MRKSICVPAIVFAGLLPTCSAHATSGATFGGPIGATDINNAYLPADPGLFAGFANVLATSNRLYDNDKDTTHATFRAWVNAVYLGYEYPFKLFGGRLASGLQLAYADPSSFQVGDQNPTYKTTGWEDVYVDFLNWSRYVGPLFGERVNLKPGEPAAPIGLTVKAEYSMIFPIGINEPDRPINNSSHTFYFIPNAAVTYLTKPDGLGGGVEFNAHMFFDHQSIDPVTKYRNGNVLDTDFAIAQNIGTWSVGMVGFYAFQLDDDHVGPKRILVNGTGNRIEALELGPIVQKYFPKSKMFFKIKATFPATSRNTLGIIDVISVLGVSF